jgi:hypothetical protein
MVNIYEITYFNWLNFSVALFGVILAGAALIWNFIRERRKVKLIYLGNHVLLINHTRRPINIDGVGFTFADRTSCEPILTELGESIQIPAEDQKRIDIGKLSKSLKLTPKYIYARDVLGKHFKAKISKEEFEYFNK